MRLKRFIPLLSCILITVIAFYCGYTTGRNRLVKRELNSSIPLNVLIYRSIKDNNPNKAAGQIGMVLMGKIDRYDSLQNDWIFKMTTGNHSFDSEKLQKYIAEARNIILIEKTNLITIGPSK